MKAVGLDTTVVVRLLTGEPATQAHAAKTYLENAYASGVKLVIHDLVVIEAYHALIYHYEVPKAEAVKSLLQLLTSPLISASGHALEAMKDYRGQGAGLVDRIIRLQLMQTADQIITFDRDFARLADVELLQDVQR